MIAGDERGKDALKLLGNALCFVDIMGNLAAPRLWARMRSMPSQSVIQGHIEEYARFLEVSADPPVPQTKEPFEKLRLLLSGWEPSREAPPEIISAARAFFESWRIGSPKEGWDNFEGVDEDEQARPGRCIGDV